MINTFSFKKEFFIKNIIYILVFVLAGCAAPIRATSDNDLAAKVFTPVKGKAVLFIFRNEHFGAAIGFPVKVNGLDIGETGAKTFFRLELATGMYSIASEAEYTSELPINLEEGLNYYVWQEVRLGIWKARNSLRQVDEKTGKEGVLDSALLIPKVSEDAISRTAIVKKY